MKQLTVWIVSYYYIHVYNIYAIAYNNIRLYAIILCI